MHTFKVKVTWKYDSKWVDDVQITKKLERFNPKIHKFFERVELESEIPSSEDDTAEPNESQSDPESDLKTSESESSDRESLMTISHRDGDLTSKVILVSNFWGSTFILVRDSIDYFKDYFSDEFVALVVQHSNLYI